MATYKVMYWQEIPSQIRAEDDNGDEISLSMPPRFADLIDKLAMKRGLTGSDDFLAEWHWGEEQDRDGTAQEVAEAVQAELEAQTYS
jgi:cvfA/B/C family virulence factor